MPSLALVAPVALPLVAGGLTAALGLAGLKPGRAIVGAGAWAGLLVLLLLWLPIQSSEELTLGPLGFGANFDLRLDAVAFAFGLVILLPSAILLTLQPRTWQEGTVAAVGGAVGGVAGAQLGGRHPAGGGGNRHLRRRS